MKQLQEILKPYFAEWQTEVDITAILHIPTLRTLRTDDENIYLQYWEYGKEFEIPNKPLNLYSEQEDLDLLELLRKLNLT